MEFVLWRHAKAEEASPGFADESRELTAKGRKKAKATAKGLYKFLDTDAKIEIWHSHADRSRQSAEVLANSISVEDLREIPAIYSGSLEEIAREIRKLENDQTIIIVGHEPYLSIWARQIAEVELPFKKCAAACFCLENQDSIQGKLQWYASPKVLAKLGENE